MWERWIIGLQNLQNLVGCDRGSSADPTGAYRRWRCKSRTSSGGSHYRTQVWELRAFQSQDSRSQAEGVWTSQAWPFPSARGAAGRKNRAKRNFPERANVHQPRSNLGQSALYGLGQRIREAWQGTSGRSLGWFGLWLHLLSRLENGANWPNAGRVGRLVRVAMNCRFLPIAGSQNTR